MTEVDDADAILEKKCLSESFFTFIKTSPEVGREKLFSLLGNALLRVGYKKVKPVLKKGRRVAYAGIAFKKECISAKLFEEKKTAISAHTVQQWMKDHYCEGGESDLISSEDLWIHFVTNVVAMGLVCACQAQSPNCHTHAEPGSRLKSRKKTFRNSRCSMQLQHKR